MVPDTVSGFLRDFLSDNVNLVLKNKIDLGHSLKITISFQPSLNSKKILKNSWNKHVQHFD